MGVNNGEKGDHEKQERVSEVRLRRDTNEQPNTIFSSV